MTDEVIRSNYRFGLLCFSNSILKRRKYNNLLEKEGTEFIKNNAHRKSSNKLLA